jgi:hypothetical protein
MSDCCLTSNEQFVSYVMQKKIKGRIDDVNDFDFLIFGVLTPLSAIFQLYHGDQF